MPQKRLPAQLELKRLNEASKAEPKAQSSTFTQEIIKKSTDRGLQSAARKRFRKRIAQYL